MNRGGWVRCRVNVLGATWLAACAPAQTRPSSAASTTLKSPAATASTTGSNAAVAGGAIPALVIDLPRAGQWRTEGALVMVELAADGRRRIDNQSVASGPSGDEDLLARLRQPRPTNQGTRVVIMADRKARHGDVIRLLDLLQQAGFSQIAFGVQPMDAGATPPAQDQAVPAAAGRPIDSSRSARPISLSHCSLPVDPSSSEAVAVPFVVAVDERGEPRWVQILKDPGYGYGQAVTQCALRARYDPGRDANGTPIPSMTPTITLRFEPSELDGQAKATSDPKQPR